MFNFFFFLNTECIFLVPGLLQKEFEEDSRLVLCVGTQSIPYQLLPIVYPGKQFFVLNFHKPNK